MKKIIVNRIIGNNYNLTCDSTVLHSFSASTTFDAVDYAKAWISSFDIQITLEKTF